MAATEQGELRLVLAMDGTAMAGRWYLGDDSGSLTGKQRELSRMSHSGVRRNGS